MMQKKTHKKHTLCNEVLSSPVHFLAFGFGSGLSPIAPGTAGTLVAIPIYLLLSGLSLVNYLLILAIVIVAGIYLCGESARRLQLDDPGGVVWDEIAGFLVTMIAAPVGAVWIILGFILFRIFDIWKPTPIRLLDKYVKGGWGIMVDDLVAGLYALICLQALYWVSLKI